MNKESIRRVLAGLGIPPRESDRFSLAELRTALASRIHWLKPDAAHLAEEFLTENSFFDGWPKDLGIRKPTREEFQEFALKYGRAVRVPHSMISTKFDDYKRVPGDEFYYEDSGRRVREALELPMPVVFSVQSDRKYVVFGGRHRIGRCWEEGEDLMVWELPYPKNARELGLQAVASAPTIEQAIHNWTGLNHDAMATYDRMGTPNPTNDLLNEWLAKQSKFRGKVYRGLAFQEGEWTRHQYDYFEPGAVRTVPNKESYTRDRSRIASYGSGDIKVLITLHSRSGVDISKSSRYPDEQEVLLPKGYRYRVITREPLEGGIFAVEIEEIP